MQVQTFTFNPFQENTFVLFDETNECIIIDPGCHTSSEEQLLYGFIQENNLKPKAIVNTHCHIDHVLGINQVKKKYNIPFYCHKGEIEGLKQVHVYGQLYGFSIDEVNLPDNTINENQTLTFGNTTLEIRFTPGHSPASLCFIHQESNQAIVGDVLFQQSIGRTDLLGGNYNTLMQSIEHQLLTLNDDVTIYPGHGPSSTIGAERKSNPFILEYLNR